MNGRWGLGATVLSVGALTVAYAAAFLPGGAPEWTPFLFAAATAGLTAGLMALGASRRGSLQGLGIPLAAIFLLLAGGFTLVLALPAEDPGDPVLWLGLPRRAALVVYGVGIVPILFVPLLYAWSFGRVGLSEGEVERVRRAAAGSSGGTGEEVRAGDPQARKGDRSREGDR